MKIFLIAGTILLAGICAAYADSNGSSTTILQSDVSSQKPGDPVTPGTSITKGAQQTDVDDQNIKDGLQKYLTTNKNFSLEAEKIDITVFNGYVTLKGTVKDQDEKATIERKAKSMDQVKHVDNQLSIG